MTSFQQIILTFPTVIFTFFLALAIIFWLVSLLGLFDLDIDLDADVDSSETLSGMFTGLLLKFRLVGYPLTLVFSAVALFAWLVCYYLAYLTARFVPIVWVQWLLGIVWLWVALWLGAWISGKMLRPLRGLFKQTQQKSANLLGKTAVVRSTRVDNHFGEAEVIVSGASLLLKVRTENAVLPRHSKVVLIGYDAESGCYQVVDEASFLQSNEGEL
ncbi:hypothetical protein [Suttonella ornithocola]|uniref:Ubiquinone biosynthesis protein UbiH n=1 Tax=Suttonella ornithocola TaxID=279832 RepID=A0A380MWA5_9GAMM|nr:hypothetical protein [Suttonella ornithocola]SUO96336.1 Uncharacterised protein [Suttonella ornithocola]